MKIFVQGTKGGYNALYPKPTPPEFYQFASDMRRIDVNNGAFRGKESYSIALANGSCIFTKYIIVHDVQRSGWGNIGFSIFIPKENKITGADAKKLLDELADKYVRNYCHDYNLDNKTEDWSFTDIATDDKLQSRNYLENLQSGTKDAAYIYYNDDDELQRHFDNPFQEEYTPYRQILFVSAELKDKLENPLNALRHSETDLTEKIDLKTYKLQITTKEGLDITVKVNDNEQYDKNNIRQKSKIEICYNQNYRQRWLISGTWQEIKGNPDHPECIDVNDTNKTITINSIALEEEKKVVYIFVTDKNKDKKSNQQNRKEIQPVRNKSITCERLGQYSITFKGDELGDEWKITAQVDGYETKDRDLKPEDYDNNYTVPFELEEQKTIEIKASDVDANKKISPIQVRLNDGNGFETKDKLEFNGDDIDKKWNITVRHNNYDEATRENYCPRTDENPLVFKLKRKSSGKKGKPSKQKAEVAPISLMLGIFLLVTFILFVALLLVVLNSSSKGTTNSQGSVTEKDVLEVITEYIQWLKFSHKIDSAIELRKSIDSRDSLKLNSSDVILNEHEKETPSQPNK